ncbi:hypothetical protein RIF29_42529 [Crotalaria pallida]|uniref:Chloroplast envelope membrane protein n=1 Tax=Crotalaria pallida TaxID=3830 RepID=A0AAN9E7Q3_CROPI
MQFLLSFSLITSISSTTISSEINSLLLFETKLETCKSSSWITMGMRLERYHTLFRILRESVVRISTWRNKSHGVGNVTLTYSLLACCVRCFEKLKNVGIISSFMSTSIVLCHNYFILFNHYSSSNFMLEEGGLSLSLGGSSSSSTISISTTRRSSSRRHLNKHFISNAEKHSGSSSSSSSSWSWWHKFFFEDDGNWLGLKEDDMVEAEVESESQEEEEDDKFEAWKQRAEAIIELREAQQDRSNQEFRRWEDWLLLDDNKEWEWEEQQQQQPQPQPQPSDYYIRDRDQEKGVVESIRSFLFATQQDDDMLYEDRVFQYASSNSAKFLAVLIIIPWAMDFLVHDYILMPFLDRYVKTVPLAAQMLDVRRYQKLEIVEELRTERGRFELEVEIGKSPPLSDDEIWWELRHKALELRDEWRLENRRAFANIWSDTVYGISLFILLYFNKSQVALLKFTGYKIINNISDTGKAFLIILITDIFLGYHSESGWQTLLEIIVDHYGLDIDHSAITVFICLVPVIIDACVKLWLFKFLPRLSPRVSNIFREMKRH